MNLIFGTDGIRGRVGRDIDEIKVLSLGIASSKYFPPLNTGINIETAGFKFESIPLVLNL